MKIPYRFWIALMVFFTTFINYAMRVNMSVNILAMERPIIPKTKSKPPCESPNKKSAKKEAKPYYPDDHFLGRRNYTATVHGQILAAYGYGYIIACIPGGFLAEYIGPFKTIFWANLVSALLTIGTFGCALGHWSAVIVVRVLIGALGGVVYPALQILISKWAPPDEKGKFVSALMGNTLGTVVTFPLVGLICEKLGWPSGFMLVTGMAVLYLIIFFILVTDTPEENKFTSDAEKEYIIKMRGESKKKMVAPYKKILTSGRFWALCLCHIGNLYGLFVILLSVPEFFKSYLNFNLKDSGGLSAMPPLLRLFTGIMFGILGDFLKKRWNATLIRKVFMTFSHILPGCCLIGMMFVGCNAAAATSLLVLNQGLNGAAVITNLQNPQDLAPNFAGTLFGIMSFVAGVSQFIVPVVTSGLTERGQENWKWVFCIGGCVYFASATIFIIFGTADRQPWNEPEEQQRAQ